MTAKWAKWATVVLVFLAGAGLIASVFTDGDHGLYLMLFGGVIALGLLATSEHR
jgi:hypothetical protein